MTVNAVASSARLEASNNATQALLLQKQDYAEVLQIQGQVSKDQAAQIVGVASEINWKKYLLLVQSSLPAGTSISSVSAKTADPGVAAEVPTGPLLQPSIASIDFIATTANLPDVSLWIENLSKIPGFADATAGTISLEENGQYTVTILMHVNEQALENRFLPDTEDAEDTETDDVEETSP